jgi:DNA-binding NtrC family response regulator
MAVVLCFSTDDVLAKTRRLILERAGHSVITAFTLREAEQACDAAKVDVAVIGQGVPRDERLRVGALVRSKCPAAKLLELYLPTAGKSLPDADDWLVVPAETPSELATKVSIMTGEQPLRRQGEVR